MQRKSLYERDLQHRRVRVFNIMKASCALTKTPSSDGRAAPSEGKKRAPKVGDLTPTPRYNAAYMTPSVQHVAVAIVKQGERWLVARRHADAHLGGLWEFPGGKSLPGESSAATALRELHEECGITAEVVHVLPAVTCKYVDRTVVLTGVVCRWSAGEAVPIGSAECRWVTAAELLALDMPAVNAGIIAAAVRAD
jgi:mutator protein MutT